MHVGADNAVTLSSDLASIMGFSTIEMTSSEERKHKGKVAVDPNKGFHSPYVYCHSAEAIPVGDIKTHLPRVVDAAGNFGDIIHFLKSGAEILGKQALNVATDILDGKFFNESAKNRFKEGIKPCARQRGAIQQSGSEVRRKRRRQSRESSKKSKKRKIDIFD